MGEAQEPLVASVAPFPGIPLWDLPATQGDGELSLPGHRARCPSQRGWDGGPDLGQTWVLLVESGGLRAQALNLKSMQGSWGGGCPMIP